MSAFTDRWRDAWRHHAYRSQLIWSLAALPVGLLLLRLYLDAVEGRAGAVLDDPFLRCLSAVDLKWITQSLTYSGLLLGIVSLCFHPYALLLVVRASVVMTAFRIICLFLLPLDPPAGVVPLVDPLIQLPFAHPTLTRDLFFSWQTAFMALFVFAVEGKDLKIIFVTCAFLVSILLLIQHVHYTIDVVAAPCFAYVAWGIARPFTVGGTA
jgi:hypothetical protein